ncbi:MAG: hypothetical protein IR158_06410 [Cellulomonas sp.]|uniref:hypothetical protein n=1 Tax=Cellulomonas sp. TaxID=40001 RepID=UPI0019D91162|nr:hypothetical protein [Cellulomonas sp.]MBF0687387.1 hypothetical protein [Cellulomonas sp.]
MRVLLACSPAVLLAGMLALGYYPHGCLAGFGVAVAVLARWDRAPARPATEPRPPPDCRTHVGPGGVRVRHRLDSGPVQQSGPPDGETGIGALIAAGSAADPGLAADRLVWRVSIATARSA